MLRFPSNCDTPAERTEYAYRAQELLRLLHNVMGRWYKEGISSSVWDKLPTKIQERYPYKDILTKVEWYDFQISIFTPLSNKIADAILEQRQLLKESTQWSINIQEL